MKRFFVTFAVLSLVAGAAVAQDFGEYANEIGIYTTTTPTGMADTAIGGCSGFGQFVTYLVISNPVDDGSGLPIGNIGGYECTVTFPAGWGIVVTLPPNTTDFDGDAPDFFVSGLIPVTGMFTVLADITFQSFGGGGQGGVFLNPYSGPQTIPGSMAITDADNNFVPSAAHPISGDYALPVAGICDAVVDNEDVSWGSIKSLYQ
jgi:hypothetical protein